MLPDGWLHSDQPGRTRSRVLQGNRPASEDAENGESDDDDDRADRNPQELADVMPCVCVSVRSTSYRMYVCMYVSVYGRRTVPHLHTIHPSSAPLFFLPDQPNPPSLLNRCSLSQSFSLRYSLSPLRLSTSLVLFLIQTRSLFSFPIVALASFFSSLF